MIKHAFHRLNTGFSCLLGLAALCSTATSAEAREASDKVCHFTSAVTDTARLRGCTKVVGDVHVERSTAETLTDLGALRTVTGTLFIAENPRLTSLEGLAKLRSVGGLSVSRNPALESVDGLDELSQASRLEISGNRALGVLSGPDALRQVDELVVRENGLFRVNGFRSLASARNVVIAKNPKLIYSSGLSQLVNVENLTFTDNPRLAPTPGLFSRLQVVRGEVSVTRCPGIRPADMRRDG